MATSKKKAKKVAPKRTFASLTEAEVARAYAFMEALIAPPPNKREVRAYPGWVCRDCALAHGGRILKNHVATFHTDTCDVCKKTKTVTEPRDYGHLRDWE